MLTDGPKPSDVKETTCTDSTTESDPFDILRPCGPLAHELSMVTVRVDGIISFLMNLNY